MWALDDFIRTVSEIALQNDAMVEDIMKKVATIQGKDSFDDDVSVLEIDFEREAGASDRQ